MNKNGFVFIETIITVVVLSASLLLLYNSYSSSYQNEKERLYYDDVALLYKTNYIRTFLLKNSNIQRLKSYAFNDSYAVTIGPDFDTMFTEKQKHDDMVESLRKIYETYNINQMVLIKKEYIENCPSNDQICINSTENLNLGLTNYLKTLNDTEHDYYLVVEYKEKNIDGIITKCDIGDTRCSTYYVSLGIDGTADFPNPVVPDQDDSQNICNGKNFAQCIKGLYTTDGVNNLYLHNSSLVNGANDGSYRYAGSSNTTNNFVCFGSDDTTCSDDDLYRIIGVFGDQVKLIKYDYANSNMLGTNGEYCEGAFAKSSEANYKGNHETINKYYWNRSWSLITGLYNDWKISSLNYTNLNTNYINYLNSKDLKWNNMISVTVWDICGDESKSECMVSMADDGTEKNIKETKKIGLMYPHEYRYATTPSKWGTNNTAEITENNWMYMGLYEWTISRSSSVDNGVNTVNNLAPNGIISRYGGMTDSRAYGIRPTFSLNSNVTCPSGDGTYNNPYRVNL